MLLVRELKRVLSQGHYSEALRRMTAVAYCFWGCPIYSDCSSFLSSACLAFSPLWLLSSTPTFCVSTALPHPNATLPPPYRPPPYFIRISLCPCSHIGLWQRFTFRQHHNECFQEHFSKSVSSWVLRRKIWTQEWMWITMCGFMRCGRSVRRATGLSIWMALLSQHKAGWPTLPRYRDWAITWERATGAQILTSMAQCGTSGSMGEVAFLYTCT